MKVILPRDGEAPLSFEGEEIASGTSAPAPKTSRRYDIVVYRVKSKADPSKNAGFAAGITYRTTKDFERPHHYAVFSASEALLGADLTAWVKDHDIRLCVTGFPAGEKYKAKHEHVMATLRSRLLPMVSEVLSKLPGASEEVG